MERRRMNEKGPDSVGLTTLTEMCIKSVVQHMDIHEEQSWDLPASLIKEILPHLNIMYLERFEPAALRKGVSTSFVWASLWRELVPKKSSEVVSDDERKRRCLEYFFLHNFLSNKHVNEAKVRLMQRCFSNLSTSSILSLTARHVRTLPIISIGALCSLATQEMRPVLAVLERSLQRVNLRNITMNEQGHVPSLYALHRLIDHGAVRAVSVCSNTDSQLLVWMLHRWGGVARETGLELESSVSVSRPTNGNLNLSATDQEEYETPCKLRKLSVMAEIGGGEVPSPSWGCVWPRPPGSCDPAPGGPVQPCPEGQIQDVELKLCTSSSVAMVIELLPYWLFLRALSLNSEWVMKDVDVSKLVCSLERLAQNPSSSLTALSIGTVSSPVFMEALLSASPSLTTFSLEVDPGVEYLRPQQDRPSRAGGHPEFCLEKCSLKLHQAQTKLESLLLVLRRSPRLLSLQVSGISFQRGCSSQSQLLTTISASNQNLHVLILEDVNLAECHSEILHLLRSSSLKELSLKDCRLLDKGQAVDFLRLFVNALKGVPSLQSLNLSQNRLAKHVIELADLFCGEVPSNITKLDISSNYILSSDLMAFGMLLDAGRPPQHLTLDLRRNPLDRDPEVRRQALLKLHPHCLLLTDQWYSRITLADHLSVM